MENFRNLSVKAMELAQSLFSCQVVVLSGDLPFADQLLRDDFGYWRLVENGSEDSVADLANGGSQLTFPGLETFVHVRVQHKMLVRRH